MDIFILIFLFMCIITIRKSTNKKEKLSKDIFCILKGICALFIVLGHISQKANSGFIFSYLEYFSTLAVSLYFFMSGYGLIKSYHKKGSEYLDKGLKNKIIKLIKEYLILSLFFWILRNAINDELSAKEYLLSFINGQPCIYYSWYMIEIILIYIFFYLSSRLSKKDDKKNIIICSIFLIILSLIYIKTDYKFYWYNSNMTFIFGMIYACYYEKIRNFIKKKNLFYLFTIILLFILSFMLTFYNKIFYQIAGIFFVQIILEFINKFKLKNIFFEILGKNSLNIYLLQGIVIFSLRSDLIFIENDIIYCSCCIIFILLISILYDYIKPLINNLKIKNKHV